MVKSRDLGLKTHGSMENVNGKRPAQIELYCSRTGSCIYSRTVDGTGRLEPS